MQTDARRFPVWDISSLYGMNQHVKVAYAYAGKDYIQLNRYTYIIS